MFNRIRGYISGWFDALLVALKLRKAKIDNTNQVK